MNHAIKIKRSQKLASKISCNSAFHHIYDALPEAIFDKLNAAEIAALADAMADHWREARAAEHAEALCNGFVMGRNGEIYGLLLHAESQGSYPGSAYDISRGWAHGLSASCADAAQAYFMGAIATATAEVERRWKPFQIATMASH